VAAQGLLGLLALVGGKHLAGLLGLAEVQIGGDRGTQVARADDGLQQGLDAPRQTGLELVLVLLLLGVQTQAEALTLGVGQQLAGLVEHADGGGFELGHAARNQVHDAGHLGAIQCAAAAQLQHHRGRGFLLLAKEAVLLWQRQVHTGVGHIGKRGDGARQLALQRALEIEPFVELGLSETGFVEQLEADQAALGQAGRGQAHAHVIDLGGGNQDGAARLDAMRHLLLGQLRRDGAAVLVGQSGEQRAEVALPALTGQVDDQGQQQQQADAQSELRAPRQRLQPRAQRGRLRHRHHLYGRRSVARGGEGRCIHGR
jgi:hypothetical protein